jgi:methyl-accepting chemotaxis protein
MKPKTILLLQFHKFPLLWQGIIVILMVLLGLFTQSVILVNFDQTVSRDLEKGNEIIIRDISLITDFKSLFHDLTEITKLKEEALLASISNIVDYDRSGTNILLEEALEFMDQIFTSIVDRENDLYSLNSTDLTEKVLGDNPYNIQLSSGNLRVLITSNLRVFLNIIDGIIDEVLENKNELRILNENFYGLNGLNPNITNTINAFRASIQGRMTNETTTQEEVKYLTQLSLHLSLVTNKVINITETTTEIYSNLLSAPFSTIPEFENIYLPTITQTEFDLIEIFDDFYTLANTTQDFEFIQELDQFILNINSGDTLISLFYEIDLVVNKLIINAIDYELLITESLPTSLFQISNRLNLIVSELERQYSTFQAEFTIHLDKQRSRGEMMAVTTAILLLLAVSTVLIPFVWKVTKTISNMDTGFRKISDKNLQIKLFKRYNSAEIGSIQRSYDLMITDLKNILEALKNSSERLAIVAQSMAASSEEASASIVDVTETISNIAHGATEQSVKMHQINDTLSLYLEEVGEVNNKIENLSNFVKKIAKRTNILGLSASIEASKAGETGLGFNQVAENIIMLSDDAKEAANTIVDMIEDISYKINRTIYIVQKDVNLMLEVTENTAASSEEANASSSEQVTILSDISEQSAKVAQISAELYKMISDFKF